MKDQKPLIFEGEEFEGLYARGVSGTSYNPICATPIKGFTQADQVRYTPWGLQSRPGIANLDISAFGGISGITQILPYSTNDPTSGGTVSGYLLVSQTGGSGTKVYSSNSPTPGTAIYTTAPTFLGDYAVSLITLFGRVIFTFHDYNQGISNMPVQLYVPGDTASRDNGNGFVNSLAGAGTNFASSATAGNVTVGNHVFAVVGVTASGHISQLTVLNAGVFNIATVSRSVDATNLPVGGADVVSRWILVSRTIPNYTGNVEDYELFFVHEVTDNVTVNVTFDFTDESLQDSADYLWDLIPFLFAQLGMTWYANRLITWGEQYGSVPAADIGPSVLRVSESGKPESFSVSHGLVSVFQDDGSFGVKNCFEYKGLLVIEKDNKSFVTRDNGGDPNTWEVDILDGAIGGIVYGVAKSLDTIGTTRADYAITMAKSGIYLFDGKYNEIPLTWKIERLWQQISESGDWLKFQAIDIPTAKLFLFLVNSVGEFTNWYFLICDYSRGLSYQTVRWSKWFFTNNQPIWVAMADAITLYYVKINASVIRKMIIGAESSEYTDDIGSDIDSGVLATAELHWDDELNQNHYMNVRMKGDFSGVTNFDYVPDTGADQALTLPPAALNNSGDVTQVIINKDGILPQLKWSFTTNGTNLFHLKKYIIFGKPSNFDLKNP